MISACFSSSGKINCGSYLYHIKLFPTKLHTERSAQFYFISYQRFYNFLFCYIEAMSYSHFNPFIADYRSMRPFKPN